MERSLDAKVRRQSEDLILQCVENTLAISGRCRSSVLRCIRCPCHSQNGLGIGKHSVGIKTQIYKHTCTYIIHRFLSTIENLGEYG